jgi:hypothetical protein
VKKILVGLLLVISFYTNAQATEFTFTADKGMTDYIVTLVDGKSAQDIYKKVIDWIKLTYKNPDKVILSTIENEYLRFEGISETLYSGVPTKYEIEISIKEGKYKFDLISMQCKPLASWMDTPIFYESMSKEDLEKRYVFKQDGTLRSGYKFADKIPTYFNNLNKSLFESIDSTVKKTDSW